MPKEKTTVKNLIGNKETKSDSPIYQKALAFAKRTDGTIDVDRAGQYIINSELVENYPQSMSFAQHPVVLEKIMERLSEKDKHKAIEYLFKFDDYTVLPASDKTKVVILNDLFDSNDPIQKQILKYVIEETKKIGIYRPIISCLIY